MKEKIFWKTMDESFKIVEEQDFNPDFVISWAMDSFDTGLIIGAVGGFIGATVVTIGLYFLNKKRGEKK